MPQVLTRDYWNSVAVRANDEMSKLKQDPEELEKNKQQLKKIFDNMKKDAIEKIDAMGNDVMNEMDDLSPEEQKLLIGFWEGVGAFFKEILDWVNTIFRKIVDLFKQGFKLVKETVKKIFQPVTDALKGVWDSLSSAFS